MEDMEDQEVMEAVGSLPINQMALTLGRLRDRLKHATNDNLRSEVRARSGNGSVLVHAERGAHAGPALRGGVHQHPWCPPIHARDTFRASVRIFLAFSPHFS